MTKKERIKNKISKMLTVKQLIEHLKNLPQDALVGKVGHYGEFHEMNTNNFFVYDSFITASYSSRNRDRVHVKVLNIDCPNIGPEPD